MARMHELLRTHLINPQAQNSYGSSYGGLSSGSSFSYGATSSDIYRRLLSMQDMLIEAVRKHDGLIQEKVAELALTGDPNET